MKIITLTICAVFMMATLTVSTGFAGDKGDKSPGGTVLDKSGEALDKAHEKSGGMSDKMLEKRGELVEKRVEQKEKVMQKMDEKKTVVDKSKEVAHEAKGMTGKAMEHSKN